MELSQCLLELPKRQRPLQVQSLLQKIVERNNSEVVFLEHLQILFDQSLQLDICRCLRLLARQRTIVAIWCGSVQNSILTYAEQGHPEYYLDHQGGLLILNLEQPS